MKNTLMAVMAAGAAMIATPVLADTIDPTSFSATLGVGESVTIRKTVVIEEGSPSDATIDAYFLIDTSGSMGGEIDAAKAAAEGIYASIAATFGSDVGGGSGVFSEGAGLPGGGCGAACTPPGTVLNQDITTVISDVTDSIDDITLGIPDGGGDFPESANTAIELVAENASWRAGSNRFIFIMSDASSKGSPDADVIAALAAEGITLVSLDFGGGAFTTDMAELGAITFSGLSDTPEDIADSVTAGIIAGFSEYGEVTVDDLDAGLPEIDVSTVCISADIGACVGADAIGMYDRSTDRTFEFDVTFTRVVAGGKDFATHALVDGGIVASEKDSFPDGEIPLPGAAWFMISGIAGLIWRRKQKAAAA